jgi:hypothetical protein
MGNKFDIYIFMKHINYYICINFNVLIYIYLQVIAAEGEQRASIALKEAADIMAESPVAIQLRYLQTLASVATERDSTIIFPLPIDM